MTNTDPDTVMVGVRVVVVSQDQTRVPSSLEIFGRTVNMTVLRPRWVEFCFTREERASSARPRLRTRSASTSEPLRTRGTST